MPDIKFSGLASGIDGEAVIKAIMDSRRLATVPMQNNINNNNLENTALEEFNTRLLNLNDALKSFLTLEGGAISKSGTSSNLDALSVTVSDDAPITTTTLEVLEIAKAGSISFDDRFSAPDQALAPGLVGAGTIDLTVGLGDHEQQFGFEITNETTLEELIADVNEQASGYAVASMVNVGTEAVPEYVFVLNGNKSGTDEGTLAVNVSTEVTSQGVFQTANLNQAQNALLDMTGIGQIVRSSNQINDLIPGVTLNLKQAGLGPVTVSVRPDASETANRVGEIINSVNQIITYSRDNSLVERVEGENGPSNIFGSLARTRLDEGLVGTLKNAISGGLASLENSEVRVFADLGITIQRDGTYNFDQDKFIEGANKEPEATEQLLNNLADKLASTDGIIRDYTKYQGQIDISVESNNSENESISNRIARLEENFQRQSEILQKMFTNLETTVGRLNSGADALNSMLISLQANR